MSDLRIQLIVTGDMEKSSLHISLKRFFPYLHNNCDVVWETPRQTYPVTSNPLVPLVPGKEPSMQMQTLVKTMIIAAVGIGEKPADLVVAIDDVELFNLGQESVIAQHVRAAVPLVLSEITSSGNTKARYQNVIRAKCSFHLLTPLPEAYMFGDTNSLATAGVPVNATPCLVHPTDVEQFESNDPLWLSECKKNNQQKQSSHPSWRYERHAKAYLRHLVERGGGSYSETKQGAQATKIINWPFVPKCCTDTPMVRALFQDISDWFCMQSPLGFGNANSVFYPTNSSSGLILRNL